MHMTTRLVVALALALASIAGTRHVRIRLPSHSYRIFPHVDLIGTLSGLSCVSRVMCIRCIRCIKAGAHHTEWRAAASRVCDLTPRHMRNDSSIRET